MILTKTLKNCNILKCISGLYFCEFLLEFQLMEDKDIGKYIDQHRNKKERAAVISGAQDKETIDCTWKQSAECINGFVSVTILLFMYFYVNIKKHLLYALCIERGIFEVIIKYSF